MTLLHLSGKITLHIRKQSDGKGVAQLPELVWLASSAAKGFNWNEIKLELDKKWLSENVQLILSLEYTTQSGTESPIALAIDDIQAYTRDKCSGMKRNFISKLW